MSEIHGCAPQSAAGHVVKAVSPNQPLEMPCFVDLSEEPRQESSTAQQFINAKSNTTSGSAVLTSPTATSLFEQVPRYYAAAPPPMLSHDPLSLQSPTVPGCQSLNASTSCSLLPSGARKKRPPSLFASVTSVPSTPYSPPAVPFVPNVPPLLHVTPAAPCPISSPPALLAQFSPVGHLHTPVRLPPPNAQVPAGGSQSSSHHSSPSHRPLLGHPLSNSMGCSTAVTPHLGHQSLPQSQSRSLVALSEDCRTLFVGPYRVTKEGCVTLRSRLLVNQKGIPAPRYPDPSATPPLRSTHMEEPLSPIAYSMDGLPSTSMLPPASVQGTSLLSSRVSNGVTTVQNGSMTSKSSLHDDCNGWEPQGQPPQQQAPEVSPELGSSSTTVPTHLSPLHSHKKLQMQQQQQRASCLRYSDLKVQDTPFEAGASASVFEAVNSSGKRFALKRIPLQTLFPELETVYVSGTSPCTILPPPNCAGCHHDDIFSDLSSPQQSSLHSSFHGVTSPSATLPHYYAQKSMPKHRQMQSILRRELQMLHSEYRSAHVVKMYNAFFVPEISSLDIVMEFMDYGCLDKLGRLVVPVSIVNEETTSSHQIAAVPRSPVDSFDSCQEEQGKFSSLKLHGKLKKEPIDETGSRSKDNNKDKSSNTNTQRGIVVRMPLPERVLAIVAEQVLRGINDMHNRGHVHRDIKPQNILVNRQGVVKLSDFGLLESVKSRQVVLGTSMRRSSSGAAVDPQTHPHLSQSTMSCSSSNGQEGLPHTPQQADTNDGDELGTFDDVENAPLCSGTDRYMSPERHRGEAHGKPADIWAIGVTLAECALGRYPVDFRTCADEFERMDKMAHIDFAAAAREAQDQSYRRGKNGVHKTIDLSHECIDFIQQCLAEDPAQRPTSMDLLSHPFLSQWIDSFDFSECIASLRDQERKLRRWTESHWKGALSGNELMGEDGLREILEETQLAMMQQNHSTHVDPFANTESA